MTMDRESIKEVFEAIDDNQDNYIQLSELQAAAKPLFGDITNEAIIQMFKSADLNGDGKISLEEFTIAIETLLLAAKKQ